MTIPDYQTLMLPLLKAAASGEAKISDIIARLATEFNLTEEERQTLLPSGTQFTFSNRVHWARTYLSKAGLLESTGRGRFKITALGTEILAKAPLGIDNKFLGRFKSFQEFTKKADFEPNGSESTSTIVEPVQNLTLDDQMRAAHGQLETELGRDLLDKILKAPPAFFERLVVNLLTAMNYGGSTAEAARALGKSGDGGVDGVIDQDALGLDRIYIQAKRYAKDNAVGPGAIRDFFGSLDRFKASKGLFVTTSTFTQSARETADLLSKRIVLINGEALSRMMIRYGVGCRIEETLHIKKVDEDFFE
ncbi:MAG: restriction endonuclease [Hyphomicrobiales bacterium]|nr:restriction endonuclease [Hyphomicrobiales bacterium]MDE2115230.1 restriction endonuclease [Hyphomicrobiales bacterium]